MHKTLSLKSLCNILKGCTVLNPSNIDTPVSSIASDSRTRRNTSGMLFAALRTQINDGARYISELHKVGVRHFLTETMPDKPFQDSVYIVVESVYDALGTLAAALRRPSATVVAVTGSTQKTQIKEILWLGLRRNRIPVFRSPRSFNSYLGVCLSVFEDFFGQRAKVLIYETGIDGPQQGQYINRILRPDIGIVTDITGEHDENFASHKDKIDEKLNLLVGCNTIVYNSADADLVELIQQRFGNCATTLVPVADATPAKLCAAAFTGIDFSIFKKVDYRTTTIPGVRGNVLTVDNFTPDIAALENALDRFGRMSSRERRKVLALGKVISSNQSIYSMLARNGFFGLSQWINFGDDTQFVADCANNISNCDVFVFGEHTPALRDFLSSLEPADHDTTLTVNLSALVHNFNHYRRLIHPQTGIVAMVKASAYGLGSIEVAKTMQNAGAAYLAVAVVDEGVEMRRAGITMPVMVMNPMTRHYEALFGQRLEPSVFSIEELERLIEEGRRLGISGYPVHIKLDTGMHRVGFLPDQIPDLVKLLKSQNQVKVESVFSHLATADCLDKDSYTRGQLECFYTGTASLEKALGHTVRRHILNTAGMMRFADCGDYEMTRLGIGLYGISPLPYPDANLQTVAALTSVVISLKHWPADTPIGYGNRGVTKRPSLIATVPIGYADGIDRHLGNGHACFVVNGVECPTIGNICMDQCMVDVTDAPDVEIGTKVEIFGENMPVERLAEALGTIPYEILTSVSPRVHRTYIS